MEQFLNSENYFPGNILELTDSQQCDEESSNQSKPPDQLTLKNLRLRKNNKQGKSLVQQLSDDKIYWNCIQYTKLFIEHLEQQGYKNIYDYLQYCNKKGILLEKEILKINQINTQQVKYDIFQCKTIHNRNYDYRNLQELVENMKKLKKTIKYEEKNDKNVTIQFFYIDNQNECTTIHQTKQNRYIAPNTINKILYDVQPLDVEIGCKVIKNCLESYFIFHKECLDSFSKDQQKIRATELENEESETNIIDYDQLSDDSLAPHFKIAPSQRQAQFQSKKFNQITKKIKILKNSSSFKI